MINKKIYWMGCDLGKQSFTVALARPDRPNEKWANLPHAEFAHTPKGVTALLAWLQEQHASQQLAGVCVEATGCYTRQWLRLLGERLGGVSVVNPIGPKRFKELLRIREKSDRVDAAACALFGVSRQPEPTPLAQGTQQKLRELYRLFLRLQTERDAHKNRLECAPEEKTARSVLRTMLKTLEREMRKLEDAMNALIQQDTSMHEDAQNAQSIPGVGPRTIQALFAEFGDLRQYTRNQLVALSGLYPREYSSGTSVYKKPRMAKGGGARIRKTLYMAAMSARRYNPHLRAFYQRLIDNGKRPMESLGAVMRKLLLLIRAVVISGAPYDPGFDTRKTIFP